MNSNKTKVVITGASGFLGSALIQQILNSKNSYQVYALTGRAEELTNKFNNENVIVLNRNCIFNERIGDIIKSSFIVNCAFPRNTDGLNFAKGLDYINVLFNAAKQFRANAVINISSQSVYSQKRTESADEESPVVLESSYAVGKYSVELLLSNICSKMPYTNLRIASLIGPALDQRVTNKMINDAINERKIKVSKNNRVFGFMDVDDAAIACISLIETPVECWKKIYTVGTGRGYSLMDIADITSGLSGKFMNIKPDVIIEEDDGTGNTSVSNSLFCKDTGFTCTFTFEESLRKIFSSKLSNRKSEKKQL